MLSGSRLIIFGAVRFFQLLKRFAKNLNHRFSRNEVIRLTLHAFRGATPDQIAREQELSKPNIPHYFPGKEETLGYVSCKPEMSSEFPRANRLFANKILQGAPMSGPGLEADMRPLVDCLPALIEEGPARLIHFP